MAASANRHRSMSGERKARDTFADVELVNLHSAQFVLLRRQPMCHYGCI
jgi:hypothetical protein